MLNRLVSCFLSFFLFAGCAPSPIERDAAIVAVILESLDSNGQEMRFDPRPLRPDPRIHTLTNFSSVIEEFEGRVEEPLLGTEAIQYEESRVRMANRLGLQTTDHTEDDDCAGMLKPVQFDQVEFVYSDCPESPFRSVIYSLARDVDSEWTPPAGISPEQVKVIRGIELALTPRGMFSASVDYYVLLGEGKPDLIERKQIVIME
jgi:hypothetical protein